MKTVAIVKKNKLDFSDLEKYCACILYVENSSNNLKNKKDILNDYLWSLLEPYVEFCDIDENNLIEYVCDKLINDFPGKNPDQLFYHTEGSFSSPKKYIEFIYGQPTWSNYKTDNILNMNDFGCLLSLKHTVIENTCIVFANKYDLAKPNFVSIDSINKNDLIRIIRRRFFHSAIVIKENTLTKYYYQSVQHLVSVVFGLTLDNDISKLSFSFLKYNLLYFFNKDKTKYVNQIATRINGSYKMYGDVLILNELEENINTNLSLHEIKRLNVLAYGRLYDREIMENEQHTTTKIELDTDGKEQEKKITPYWSKFIVVEHRMLKWIENKNKCINCDKKMNITDKMITCNKCFRIKYCSVECEKEFNSYHYDECFN